MVDCDRTFSMKSIINTFKKRAMTVRILARGLALLFMILPGVSLPLGLGEITVDTHLNQPLRAEIKLVAVRPQDVEYIRIKLAPTEAFDRAGISRPYVLTQLDFTPTVKNDGQTVVFVSSKNPIREPFLNFLVEVVWPKGRLMREYTVLLDPPVFVDRQRSIDAKAQSLSAGSGAERERGLGSAGPGSARLAPYAAPMITQANRQSSGDSGVAGTRSESTQADSQTYMTQRGDTLSGIVRDRMFDDGFSMQQKMIATLRANPEAFVGNNINNLKTSKVLRLPDQAEMELIGREEARAEVARQHAKWRDFRAKLSTSASPQPAEVAATTQPTSKGQAKLGGASEGSLEILASNETEFSQGSAVSTEEVDVAELQKQVGLMQELAESRLQENEELTSRNKELEEIIAQQDRLIKLQSEEIANLQQSSTAQVATESPDLPEEASVSTESTEPVKLTGSTEVQSPAAAEEEASPGDTVKSQAEAQSTDSHSAPASTPAPTPTPAPVTRSLLDDVISNPMLPLGLAGLGLLLAVLAWMVVKGTKKAEQEAVTVFEDQDFQREPALDQPDESDQPKYDSTAELPASKPETEDKRFAEKDQPIDDEPQRVQASEGDFVSGESQKDALTDADVYIAYGMHEEAEQRLKEAIAQNPENEKYRVKLLEVYHGAGNQKAFDTLAQTLHGTQLTNAVLWERVLSMGREISPDNPLYSDGEPEKTAKSEVELDVESDEEDLKKSIDQFITNLTPEPDRDQPTTPVTEEESQLVDVGPESEVSSEHTDRILDFDVDDLDFDPKSSEAQDASFDAQRLDVSSDELLDFELTDLEVDALKGVAEDKLRHREADINVLDDKSAQDPSASETGRDTALDRPTEILDASLIEKHIFDELADQDAEFLGDKPDMAAVDMEGGSKLTGESDSTNAYPPAVEGLADKPDDIESILEGLTEDQLTESKWATEEIETSDHDTAVLPPEDEVNTKLDLARAYIDMGDSDGARSTLEEVLEEGDNKQCKEAQELLKQIA